MVLEEHQRGATILFSTHVMAQAEEMCHHIVMLHQGRKVLDESVASIHGHYDPRTIEFEPVDSHADISPLAHLPGILRVDRNDLGYKILLADGTDPARAMHQIIDAVRPARLELARPRLEDVFISLVSGEREDRQALRAGLSDTIGEERL
jgi:ABC-2 type transport system ATP-binding protein